MILACYFTGRKNSRALSSTAGHQLAAPTCGTHVPHDTQNEEFNREDRSASVPLAAVACIAACGTHYFAWFATLDRV